MEYSIGWPSFFEHVQKKYALTYCGDYCYSIKETYRAFFSDDYDEFQKLVMKIQKSLHRDDVHEHNIQTDVVHQSVSVTGAVRK